MPEIIEIIGAVNQIVVGDEETSEGVIEVPADSAIEIVEIMAQGVQGVQGLPGTSGAIDPANFVIGETPTGAVNGSNATFLTAFDFIPETVAVFVEEIRLRRITNFQTTGTRTILLNFSPLAGERIQTDYLRS